MKSRTLPLYIDGADEATRAHHLIKGGGGALTREKIIAAAAARFICIVDESKLVGTLGAFPLPIEVIPMARSLLPGSSRRAARGRCGARDSSPTTATTSSMCMASPLRIPPALEMRARRASRAW